MILSDNFIRLNDSLTIGLSVMCPLRLVTKSPYSKVNTVVPNCSYSDLTLPYRPLGTFKLPAQLYFNRSLQARYHSIGKSEPDSVAAITEQQERKFKR